MEADGRAYLKSNRRMYVSEASTEIVDFPPPHPGVRVVSGLLRTYQINANDEISHCKETESGDGIKMSFPDGFIFYYVGTVAETNLRNFRISYEVNAENFRNGPQGEWVHIDYMTTRTRTSRR